MLFNLLFVLLLSQLPSISKSYKRYEPKNYISDNTQNLMIKYYSTLNNCYQDKSFHTESETYYENCDCFSKIEDCKYKVIQSSNFTNRKSNIIINISKCLNYYESKSINIFDTCLNCDFYFVNLDISVKNDKCTSFIYLLGVIGLIILIFLGIYILDLIKKKDKKKYIIIRNENINS